MQLGFIERTPKGRIATESAYQHMKADIFRDKTSQRFLI
jgi:Holliday junction resolvasome RuvABC ATP-dependent DNA helicase subunit